MPTPTQPISVSSPVVNLKEEQVNIFVGPLQRVRPKNGIFVLVVVVVLVVPLRSEFIGEL